MPTYQTQGIVLRRLNIFEADQIITLYTRHNGKVRALAKGIRRAKSRRSGHLELFMLSELTIAKGRNLDVIASAHNQNAFPNLRKSLESLSEVMEILEITDLLTPEEHNDTRLFDLLAETFLWLEQSDEAKNRPLLIRAFEIKFLTITGHAPELKRCVRCGGKLTEKGNGFSFDRGGVICQKCGVGDNQAQAISSEAIKTLRLLSESDFATIARVVDSPAVFLEAENILTGFLQYLLDRKINSKIFASEVRTLKESETSQ